MMSKKSILFIQLLIAFCIGVGETALYAQDKPEHPLDPLSAQEIRATVEILKEQKLINEHTLFNVINLKEPPKKEVLAYRKGVDFRREAFVSFCDYAKPGVTEAVLDLRKKEVVSVTPVPKATGVSFRADSVAHEILKQTPQWVEALKKRGISIDSVTHRSIFTGDIGLAPAGHREKLVKARYKHAQMEIEGLLAYVDFTTGKVLKIIDEKDRFSKRVSLNYFNKDSLTNSDPGPKPLIVSQPLGPSFDVRGHEISWQRWKLRYGLDNREGLVLYDVRFVDGEVERPVMYRASMPEMVVPYASPDLFQASYNFFDAGEYRLGQATAKPLTPGADAPENALYMPATFHKEQGEPFVVPRAVAIFEEPGGTLWRHGTVARRATNLSLKYYTTIGNYDYAFKWTFKQDGTISVDVELTGVVQIKGVHRANDQDLAIAGDHSFENRGFGTLVRPNVEAVNHQHFFAFRLDMDIDGPDNNSVMEMNTVSVPPGKDNPLSNAITVRHQIFKTEQEAQRDVNYLSNRSWHIFNSLERTPLGQEVGYMLMPGHQAKPFVSEKELFMKKAGFLKHQVWVTPYDERERYPAGRYPASKQLYEGLPEWSEKNRSIDGKDLVLWYVTGITHIVRPEEWPVMPTHHMGFSLMPFGFFLSNPTMDLANPEFLKGQFPEALRQENGKIINPEDQHY